MYEFASEDMMIIDNLATHKVGSVREAIEAKDTILFYLRSYSTDLNIPEMAFHKLESLLRKYAERTVSAL
ncbi:MAG: transposase [Sodalis sp. (in: enterobacteria)]